MKRGEFFSSRMLMKLTEPLMRCVRLNPKTTAIMDLICVTLPSYNITQNSKMTTKKERKFRPFISLLFILCFSFDQRHVESVES